MRVLNEILRKKLYKHTPGGGCIWKKKAAQDHVAEVQCIIGK
jgi:hypothetical protein